ncbi:hypothetical protein M0R45_026532 [Rubus argutus]|uniref:Uncharacterized protein n=1 Tax=Rubus argutus TaxID=59490 RepID=A0AAW1X1B4_RUBAR
MNIDTDTEWESGDDLSTDEETELDHNFNTDDETSQMNSSDDDEISITNQSVPLYFVVHVQKNTVMFIPMREPSEIGYWYLLVVHVKGKKAERVDNAPDNKRDSDRLFSARLAVKYKCSVRMY